jgi:hypothetical protein
MEAMNKKLEKQGQYNKVKEEFEEVWGKIHEMQKGEINKI